MMNKTEILKNDIKNCKKIIILNDNIVVICKKLTLHNNKNRKYKIIVLNENCKKYNCIDNLLLCDVFRYVNFLRENNYNIF